MVGQSVDVLVPGQLLNESLYDENGRLLLDKGRTLTKEMTSALVDSNKQFIYLGDWNAEDFARYSQAIPLSDYREVAKQLGGKLSLNMDSRLSKVDLDPKAVASSYEPSIDHSLILNRSVEQVAICVDAHADGIKSMFDINHRFIKADEVAEAATGIVDSLMGGFPTDGTLLNKMTNLYNDNEYTGTHAVNTGILSINIATAMKLDKHQVREVGIGALLHNIGMSMVPAHIVNDEKKLDNAQHIDIQKHIGYDLFLLEQFKGLPISTRIILYQNKERIHGTGYPRRRSGNTIHKFAQIVAVADVYDAMTTDRPWREAHHPYRTMEYLLSQAHKKFDAATIKGLLQYMLLFPIGVFVSLDNGDVARVVHSNFDDFYHPIISVLFDAENKPYAPPSTVDLRGQKTVKVASIVEEDIKVDDHIGFV